MVATNSGWFFNVYEHQHCIHKLTSTSEKHIPSTLKEKKNFLGMTKVEQDKENANVAFNYFYRWRPQEHKVYSVVFEDKGALLNCFSTAWAPHRAPRAASLLRVLRCLILNFFFCHP